MRYRVGAEQVEFVPGMSHRPGGVYRAPRTAPVGPTHAVDAAQCVVACGIPTPELIVLDQDWEAAFVEKCPRCFTAILADGGRSMRTLGVDLLLLPELVPVPSLLGWRGRFADPGVLVDHARQACPEGEAALGDSQRLSDNEQLEILALLEAVSTERSAMRAARALAELMGHLHALGQRIAGELPDQGRDIKPARR